MRMVANVVGKKFSEVKRAYLAGFLDADGAIMAIIEKHQGKKYGYRVRVVFKITQCNDVVLFWFKNTFEVGLVRKNKTTYDWIIRDQKQVYYLLQLVAPYCKVKQNQVRIAMKILTIPVISKQNLLECAQLADTLSKFNVRSKNRRKNYASMVQEHLSRND